MTCACGQPTNDGYLCHDCTHLLNVALFTAWLGPQLDIARSRQAVLGERNGGRSHERPLPYDVRTAAARDHLAMVLRNLRRELLPQSAA